MKYAVLVVLDLDVAALDGEDARLKVEKLTEDRVRTGLETAGRGITIKMMRTKLLGLSEKLPAGEEEGDYLPE